MTLAQYRCHYCGFHHPVGMLEPCGEAERVMAAKQQAEFAAATTATARNVRRIERKLARKAARRRAR